MRERLTKEEREERVRTFIEGYIIRRGQLPTVAEVTQAVGGSANVAAALLREYRMPSTTRTDERRVANISARKDRQ